MKLRALLSTIASLTLIQAALCSPNDEAEKKLKSWVDEVVTVADRAPNTKSLRQSISPILERCINFDFMTRRAVGPAWRQLAPGQQKEVIRLFTTLIIRTYTAKFTPGEHAVITFKQSTSPAPGRIEIPTTIVYKGSHYEVIYRQEESAAWRITDVVIEGVSMVANYRTQFDSELRQGGATSLISSLNQSVDTQP